MKISRRMSVAYAITIVLLISLNLTASITSSTPSQQKEESLAQNTIMSLLPGQSNMTFTSDITMNLTTGSYISFTSGFKMNFTSGTTIIFTDVLNSGMIQPCFVGQMAQGVRPTACSWWEILNALGNPTGFEFHVDSNQYPNPNQFHIDAVFPGPYQIAPGATITAMLKIYEIYPCTFFVARYPSGYTPPSCSWWEILSPPQWNGVEFHVDGGGGGEFHIDSVTGPMIPLPFPVYEVVAERKIAKIEPCQWFITAPELVPDQCSWWEILSPTEAKGYEFHVDTQYTNGTFHVDSVTPSNITFSTPTPWVTAERKISTIKPCVYLKYVNATSTLPQPCDWWEVTYPASVKGYEFHIDYANSTYIHVDDVRPNIITGITEYQIIVERKIASISPCDWLKVVDPKGWHPDICSWWKIVSPAEWSGVIFHVDGKTDPNVDGYCKFHFDYLGGPFPPAPTPPPWNVTAAPIDPPMYWKKGFVDYAPSGVPDFDERQVGTYIWQSGGTWTHCSPTAVANSLWWLDSEFEKNNTPPPTVSDSFPLVSSYGIWDDHSPLNVQPLIEHLASLMDTDGRRTGIVHMGTNVKDMEDGLAQYLSWTGVNPIGDVNGDGVVNQTDVNIVTAAYGSKVVGGVPTAGWNMVADIYPVTTGWPSRLAADNAVDINDVNLVTANMNKTGMFNERTIAFPEFSLIESEVEKCEDVVLALGFWTYQGGEWERLNYTTPYPNTGRNGHSVTVAGVNSTTFKIAISDPAFDAYETGLTPEGRIPVPHVHGAEPPYITHDNASLVSQDVYSIVYIPPGPGMPPFPGGWAIVNYAGMLPPTYTVIEGAVITSPSGIHDVAVTNVTNSKADCSIGVPTVGQNYTLRVNVTVANQGNWNETFNVTAYADSTAIGSQNITLANGTSTVIKFVWNTTGFTKANYTISGAADIVLADANTTNNNMTDRKVLVSLIGDVNGDKKVRVDDVLAVAQRYGTNRGGPPNSVGYYYDSNCDINDDDKIRVDDVLAAAQNFGQGPW
jgi:hypothetical protein